MSSRVLKICKLQYVGSVRHSQMTIYAEIFGIRNESLGHAWSNYHAHILLSLLILLYSYSAIIDELSYCVMIAASFAQSFKTAVNLLLVTGHWSACLSLYRLQYCTCVLYFFLLNNTLCLPFTCDCRLCALQMCVLFVCCYFYKLIGRLWYCYHSSKSHSLIPQLFKFKFLFQSVSDRL